MTGTKSVEESRDCPCSEAFKRVAYCDDCPSRAVSFGAVARAEALAAGYPDWVNVTRWPVGGDDGRA